MISLKIMYCDSDVIWRPICSDLGNINRDFWQMLAIANFDKRKEFANKCIEKIISKISSKFPKHTINYVQDRFEDIDEKEVIYFCFSGYDFFVNCIPLFAVVIVANIEDKKCFFILNPITGDLISMKSHGLELNHRIHFPCSFSNLDAIGSDYFIILNSCLGRFKKSTLKLKDDKFFNLLADTMISESVLFE